MLKEIKKAYDEIIGVLRKHVDIVNLPILELEAKAMVHLFGIELKEKYGFDINPMDITSTEWQQIGNYDYLHISTYGDKNGRTISWEDNDNHPENEVLLHICFPTGGYTFCRNSDDDYPKEFFQEFWQELKSYNPKYTDTRNNCLYFAMENAGKISNEFETILKKYQRRYKEDYKLREIKKLEKEIKRLKN